MTLTHKVCLTFPNCLYIVYTMYIVHTVYIASTAHTLLVLRYCQIFSCASKQVLLEHPKLVPNNWHWCLGHSSCLESLYKPRPSHGTFWLWTLVIGSLSNSRCILLHKLSVHLSLHHLQMMHFLGLTFSWTYPLSTLISFSWGCHILKVQQTLWFLHQTSLAWRQVLNWREFS